MIKSDFANFFFALGSDPRLKILQIIDKNPGMVLDEIYPKMKLGRITVLHHLRVLERAGIILAKKSGANIEYFFNAKKFFLMAENQLKSTNFSKQN